MTDKTIRPGDLVWTVKRLPCCGKGKVGIIFKVLDIERDVGSFCYHCGRAVLADVVVPDPPDGGVVLLSRIKKIDPDSKPESITRDEELTV
jgi:hypothetical protein